MSVYKLSSQYFSLSGNSMNVNVAGNLLVLFKMNDKDSLNLEPTFLKLPTRNNTIKYAVCDLTQSRDIIEKSRASTTPIQKPPTIILYLEGKPFALFKGSKDLPSLEKFIVNAMIAYQNQRTQQQQQNFVQPPQQNMYGGQQPQGTRGAYMPEIANINSKQAKASGVHHSMQQQCADDDEDCLKMPENIIPHNLPWESDLLKLIDNGKL
jgi:hypothetical protein